MGRACRCGKKLWSRGTTGPIHILEGGKGPGGYPSAELGGKGTSGAQALRVGLQEQRHTVG
eukprot:8894110-Alexandrium_andersonii.AAC.1